MESNADHFILNRNHLESFHFQRKLILTMSVSTEINDNSVIFTSKQLGGGGANTCQKGN